MYTRCTCSHAYVSSRHVQRLQMCFPYDCHLIYKYENENYFRQSERERKKERNKWRKRSSRICIKWLITDKACKVKIARIASKIYSTLLRRSWLELSNYSRYAIIISVECRFADRDSNLISASVRVLRKVAWQFRTLYSWLGLFAGYHRELRPTSWKSMASILPTRST